MDESPQILRRWNHFKQAYTKREKSDWMQDFIRMEAAAPPPPPPQEPDVAYLVPPPEVPAGPPPVDTSKVFATLWSKMADLE